MEKGHFCSKQKQNIILTLLQETALAFQVQYRQGFFRTDAFGSFISFLYLFLSYLFLGVAAPSHSRHLPSIRGKHAESGGNTTSTDYICRKQLVVDMTAMCWSPPWCSDVTGTRWRISNAQNMSANVTHREQISNMSRSHFTLEAFAARQETPDDQRSQNLNPRRTSSRSTGACATERLIIEANFSSSGGSRHAETHRRRREEIMFVSSDFVHFWYKVILFFTSMQRPVVDEIT